MKPGEWPLSPPSGTGVHSGISLLHLSLAEGLGSHLCSFLPPVETHNLHTLHTILSTGSPLKAQSYEYVYRCIKSTVLLGSISGRAKAAAAGGMGK